AQAAGCSPTALYLYYRNIDDLLEHLRMDGHALLAGSLRRVDPALPAVEQVRAMGRAYYEFGMKHPHYYALMFSLRSTETPRREAVHHVAQEHERLHLAVHRLAAGRLGGAEAEHQGVVVRMLHAELVVG